jgi:exonuclease SbcC
MKFKQLEIRNINSIAEAVVDFEHLMPEDQHIFMIWGPSGAGKSTILDAICMALFCKTPRLQSIAEKKENQYVDPEFQFSDRAKGIAINDLRQYLKRGTKEGWCSLQFVGNDSVTYTAKTAFSINRNGNLNNIEWSLTSENGVWSKVKEVEQQLITVTGLTYEQFCRTTMLAQGEFTKFMKSDQNAKAEILEKLTDTSIFSEIGRRIYEKYNAQKKAFEQLNSENENITRLDAEQIAEYQQNIQDIAVENKQIELELAALNQKSAWIKQLAQYQEDVAKSVAQWQSAEAVTKSEEYLRTQELVQRWEKTENERKIYNERNQFCQNAQQLQENEKTYQSNYQILTSGLQHYKQQLEQLYADIEKIQDELKSQAFKSEVYAHAPILSEKLKQYAGFQQELSLIDGKIKVTTASIGQFGDVLEKKKAEIALQQEVVTTLMQEAEVLKSQSQQFDLSDLTRQQTEKTNLLNQLKNVQKSVQDLRKQQDEITSLKNAVNAQQLQVQELNQQFEQAQQRFVAAQAAQATAQKCYDSAAQSVNDFAKQIRAGLQVGDTCPVCGQKVEQLLTNEAVEQSVKALQQQLAEANKAVDDSKKALNTVTTDLSRAQGSFDAAQKDLQLKSQQQKSALSALGEVCQTLNITMDKTIDEQLDNQIAATKEEAQVITQRIENAIQLNKQLTEKTEQLSKQNKKLEQLTADKHQAEVNLATAQKSLDGLREQQTQISKNIEVLRAELSASFSDIYPNWEENPLLTAQTLDQEVKSYEKRKEELKSKQDAAEKGQIELQQIQAFEKKVLAIFTWPVAKISQNCDNLTEKWMQLAENCALLAQKQSELSEKTAQAESFLQNFYQQSPGISEELLSQLAALTAADIAQRREQLKVAQEQVQTALGKRQQAQETLQKHEASKPEMAEGEQLSDIERQIFEKDALKTEKSQQIGQIQLILQQDADNKQKYADTLAKLDALQQQVRQWERLNNTFGDSNGKVFRRIAQSFILQKLLDNTNYFLGMLSDRYELTGAGRELMILVKDKYLGDAPRPVEMVSGGESFLISIALALGLSNLALQGVSSDFLFIDEGISQLDGSLCDSVVNTLQQLHHIVHCNIGIISHLDVLADKIPTKIVVQPVSHGTSEVTVAR